MNIPESYLELDPEELLEERAKIEAALSLQKENELLENRWCQRCFWWQPEKRYDDNAHQEARCAARSSVGSEVRTEYNSSCPDFTTRAAWIAKARKEGKQ